MNRIDLSKMTAAAALLAGVLGFGTNGFAEEKKPAAEATLAAAKAEAAGEANTLTDKEKADGWQLLFDGKTADHWRGYNQKELPKGWEVVDGALVRKGAGDIITKEKYESFELVLDYKISKGGNSGLMFRVTEVEKKPPYDSGPEIQIQDNVDGKDPQKAGWLYQMYPPPNDPATNKPVDATKPAGEWNTIRFALKGDRGEIHMNGTKYSEWEIGSADWNERLAKSKFKTWPNFAKAKSGHICLQDHGNEVAFRNIKIRKIEAGKEKTAAK